MHMIQNKTSIKLTVMYENPFWIGVFERSDNAGYSVARTIFGAEPTDPELYQFLLTESDDLRFSTPNKESGVEIKKKNPKRLQREVRKDQCKTNLVSKAQDALRIELEKNKKIRKENNKARREEEERKSYELKKEKRKKKKRGH